MGHRPRYQCRLQVVWHPQNQRTTNLLHNLAHAWQSGLLRRFAAEADSIFTRVIICARCVCILNDGKILYILARSDTYDEKSRYLVRVVRHIFTIFERVELHIGVTLRQADDAESSYLAISARWPQ